eukprot:TRINITY_DN4978_c0_g1_i2.p1 TRINITY_DN4978_c0_g1~~TRINITY_DN4978_c0_g1_i2.p1  ORF type:complete len:246 (+),score=58.52 TRINITY_DN4978_c0_g1_i2:304-1041(+)
MTGRDFEIKEGDEMVDIDIGPAIDKLKHNPVPAVHMDRGGERFPEKPSEQISGETTEQRIDYEKINNAVKPRVTGMQEFHKGKVKEVKEFRIKEQRKKESKVQSIREERSEADGESFAKFQEDKELQRVKQKEEQEQQDKKKQQNLDQELEEERGQGNRKEQSSQQQQQCWALEQSFQYIKYITMIVFFNNFQIIKYKFNQNQYCLLYTSDAADEEDSVDLGGRRVDQKKKSQEKEDRGVQESTL